MAPRLRAPLTSPRRRHCRSAPARGSRPSPQRARGCLARWRCRPGACSARPPQHAPARAP
eukprot:scaffold8736_cov39-Phaeocystis_antarctica.AAC.2